MRPLVHVSIVMATAALSAAAAQAQPTSKACEFSTAAEVAAALQRDAASLFRIGSADPDIPGASECGYGDALHVYHQPSLHRLPGAPPLSIDAFDADAASRVQSGELTPAPGIGDAAWFYRNESSKEYGVLIRVGQQLLRMSIPRTAAASETAARTALTRLAETAAAKLH